MRSTERAGKEKRQTVKKILPLNRNQQEGGTLRDLQ